MSAQLTGMKLAVLLERGVNEIEFHLCRLRPREAGAEVVVVGNQELSYQGEDHEILRADVTIGQVDASGFDGVLIPGGLAPEKLRQNPDVVRFVRGLYDRGKVCAAICHGQQVLISAGLLRGRRAVSAWSMVDDLVCTGAVHVPEARAVRDGTLVTARYPQDAPFFFGLIWEAVAGAEGRPVAAGAGNRLRGRRVGILADEATNAVQLCYARSRIEEEGGEAPLIGRSAGRQVRLGSPTWEWAERGPLVTVDLALEDVGVVVSDDLPYDALDTVRAADLDGLVIPGGLATWLIRDHPGLCKLIRDMCSGGKPIASIERGAKILLSAGVLSGCAVTGGGEVRDDLTGAGLDYRDEPIARHENLMFCRGTEDLPTWGPAWVAMLEEEPA